MLPHKISVKVFADPSATAVTTEEFVRVFHRWIQAHSVPDHLLIDVADYGHVHQGPGAVLVAHEANFCTDSAGGRLGLMYFRKTPAPGEFRDRLRQAINAALAGCERLEREERLAGRVRFDSGELEVRLNDRLLAPANAETVREHIHAVATELFGQAAVEPIERPGELLAIRVKVTPSPAR